MSVAGLEPQRIGAVALRVGALYFGRIADLEPIVAAVFLEYDMEEHSLSLFTLVDKHDAVTEGKIQTIAMELVDNFARHRLDCAIVDLHGENPETFIPSEAVLVYRRPLCSPTHLEDD